MKTCDGFYSDGPLSPVAEALELIGTNLIDGWKAGMLEPNDQSQDLNELAENRLVRWLVDRQVSAFSIDDEGAYTQIKTHRFTKPYFAIDSVKSLFCWAPNEWAPIFISRRDLSAAIDRIRPGTARQSITYDWRKIVCTMWMVALEYPDLRTQIKLIGHVQQIYQDRTGIHPDEKELRPVARLILCQLGDQILSREVSGKESSSDKSSASA